MTEPISELNPTGRTVIILCGDFAGSQGVCLGTIGSEGRWAVSPHNSNDILELRFGDDFGIVLNAGQRPGRS